MAKIYYSLYDRMLNEKGLLQAFAKVKSNKGSPGVDGQTIEDFAEHLTEEIAVLADTHRLRSFEGRIDRSRIRGPYVRFCERDEAKASPYSILPLIYTATLIWQGAHGDWLCLKVHKKSL